MGDWFCRVACVRTRMNFEFSGIGVRLDGPAFALHSFCVVYHGTHKHARIDRLRYQLDCTSAYKQHRNEIKTSKYISSFFRS